MATNHEDAVLTEEQHEEFRADIKRIVSGLRSSGFACTNFAQLLTGNDDDSLTRRVIGTLTPEAVALLSIPVEHLTVEDFNEFPRVSMAFPSQVAVLGQLDLEQEAGVYVLLIEGKDGTQWALYVGCSGAMGFRLWSHFDNLRKAHDDGSTGVYAVCKRLKAQPQMIQLAVDEPESPFGFKEFVESVIMVKLNTIHEVKTGWLERQLAFVKDMQPPSDGQPAFIGCNRQLSISQAVNSAVRPEAEIECRHCNLAIASAAYVLHLHEAHNDDEPPLECPKCSKRFEMTAMGFGKHVKDCQRYPCPDPECEKTFSGNAGKDAHYLFHHTDERPHACDECPLSFQYAIGLQAHMAVHVDEASKPFGCKPCMKRFMLQSHLLQHEQRHHEEPTLKCDECGFATSRTDVFETHLASTTACNKNRHRPYRSSEELNKNKQYVVWCYTYNGCTYKSPQHTEHVKSHSVCKYCWLIFPSGNLHKRDGSGKFDRKSNHTKELQRIFAEHERICPQQDAPLMKPHYDARVFATVDNTGVSITGPALRKYFIGSKEFTDRIQAQPEMPMLGPNGLQPVAELYPMKAASSETVNKFGEEANGKESGSNRRPLADTDGNIMPQAKKFMGMDNWVKKG